MGFWRQNGKNMSSLCGVRQVVKHQFPGGCHLDALRRQIILHCHFKVCTKYSTSIKCPVHNKDFSDYPVTGNHLSGVSHGKVWNYNWRHNCWSSGWFICKMCFCHFISQIGCALSRVFQVTKYLQIQKRVVCSLKSLSIL